MKPEEAIAILVGISNDYDTDSEQDEALGYATLLIANSDKSSLYETEIKPLLSSTANLSQSELIFDLSKSFYELRKASNKQHFLDGEETYTREELTAEIRRRAIEIVVECMGIVKVIDGEKESEE